MSAPDSDTRAHLERLGFLVMMAVFNRFDSSLEEAARDMGASEWTVFKEVTLPLITPGIVAAGLVRIHPVRCVAASLLRRSSLALCESTFGEFHDDVGGFVRPAPMCAFP